MIEYIHKGWISFLEPAYCFFALYRFHRFHIQKAPFSAILVEPKDTQTSIFFWSPSFLHNQLQLASGEEQRKSLEKQIIEAVSKGLSAEEELASVTSRMARYLNTDAELLSVSSALEQARMDAGLQQQAVMQVC